MSLEHVKYPVSLVHKLISPFTKSACTWQSCPDNPCSNESPPKSAQTSRPNGAVRAVEEAVLVMLIDIVVFKELVNVVEADEDNVAVTDVVCESDTVEDSDEEPDDVCVCDADVLRVVHSVEDTVDTPVVEKDDVLVS